VLLLVQTTKGVFAYRIDPEGKALPVTLQ
jgi:hypothetical protein